MRGKSVRGTGCCSFKGLVRAYLAAEAAWGRESGGTAEAVYCMFCEAAGGLIRVWKERCGMLGGLDSL